MNPSSIKHLQVERDRLKQQEIALKAEVSTLQAKYTKAIADRKVAEMALKDAQKEPRLSEHALLRYIERLYGVDLKSIEEDIMTEANKKAIRGIISGKLPLEQGGTLVIKDMTVVSVTD